MITIVHALDKSITHYIGRPAPLCNIFSHKPTKFHWVRRVETVDEAVDLYNQWVRSRPDKMELIMELPEDAVLGCWCDPGGPCHGNVIIAIWKELHGK